MSNKSLNKAMLIGNLTEKPSTRYTQSNTAVSNFTVATNESYKDKSGEWQDRAEFHRVVAWGRTAEICQEYLKKGSQVYVEGPIETKKWEDKDGNERYTTEIKVLTMTMLDSKPEKGNQPTDGSLDSSVDLSDADESDPLPF